MKNGPHQISYVGHQGILMRIRPTKPSSVLGVILSILFAGTQQCLDASKSMGSKFIFECVCTQLPKICRFHFFETGLLYPTTLHKLVLIKWTRLLQFCPISINGDSHAVER